MESESSLGSYAKPDLARASRQGFPEAIYGPGKTAPQIVAIAKALLGSNKCVLATKVENADQVLKLSIAEELPAQYIEKIGLVVFGELPAPVSEFTSCGDEAGQGAIADLVKPVALIAAGTVDLPVAEEAFWTLASVGIPARRFYDVGVAGLHRLLDCLSEIETCSAAIVVAGMDGALPSVVCGLVSMPVVAVPTAVGYGTGLGGLTALANMLNSCSPGLVAVNIDNGFGAAVAIVRILQLSSRLQPKVCLPANE
ncbi:MAG: nickel pincer cofactor biosynthesis protein LarB [Candidatus Obscuribacterales bacterium]|nr:nickel pincer cofactor biosynthesis protein LarB [Candidatus Obscuribacterales bacterium]